MRTERSYCRVCTSQCGVLVDIDDDETVLRVRGDKAHPVTHGYTCPKGRALPQMHHHPDRIERPLMRGTEGLQPVEWSAALDDIAAKLRATIDAHGPASVGIFFGSGIGMDAAGYRMAELLHQTIGTPAKFSPLTIDGTAKTLVGSLVGGFPGFSPRPDFERVKLVLYVGINPMISHGHTVAMPNPAPTIKAVAATGQVWVIDPRRSETADFATHHIAPHPGTDYAILAHLVRQAIARGVADDLLLAKGDVGLAGLSEAVAPFTLEHASELSGVPDAAIAELDAAVAAAGPLAVETGTGITMSEAANITQWLAWALMIVTGSMNRPGGVWFHPGFVRPLDMAPLPVITQPFGPGPASRPELQGFVGDWPCAALPDEIEAGNIRAFLNLGGNLLRCFPDASRLIPALEKLELFATVEIIANETSALSSHVLPTKDQLERPDMTLWDFLSPRVDAQFTPAMVRPLGDRRAGWWVFAELVRRLGGVLPDGLPGDDRVPGADLAVVSRTAEYARCSFAELEAERHAERDHAFPAPWVDRHIATLGGWRLSPPELVAQLDEVHGAQVRALTEPLVLRFTPRRQQRHVNAQFLFLGDTPDILLNPDDAMTLGIGDGVGVTASTDRGALTGVARVDARMRQGVVSIPHGHRDANVNWLTDSRQVDRLTGMVRYSGLPVTVRPVLAPVVEEATAFA